MLNISKFVVLLCTLLLTACSHLGVKPWEKDLLAKEEMLGVPAFEQKCDDHIYFSKEGSSGGASFGGGGCGCN